MVISSGEKIISITKRQFSFLKCFLATGDVEEGAKAAGVETRTATNWFKQPRFRQFIQERLQYAADRNGCTFDWAVSELKGLWAGKVKKDKVQMDAMKEINRMLGHVKEFQGGINAREFINAEYVVIQKTSNDAAFDSGPKPAQVPGPSRSIEGSLYLPDVRAAVGQDDPNGLEAVQGDGQALLNDLVSNEPVETSQGHDLEQAAPDTGTKQGQV